MNFVLKLFSPDRFSTGAIAFRVACLDHKPFDYSVEDKVVVVSIFGMSNKIFNRLRALIGEEIAVYFAHACINYHMGRKSLFLRHFLLLMRLDARNAFVLEVSTLF